METARTQRLPPIRVTPEMKSRLRRLTQHSVARNMADHVRFALERYLDEQEALLQQGEEGDESE